MTEKFLPYGRQTISDEDVAAVVNVLRSDYLTQGPAIEAFEAAIASFIGCKHAIALNSGTAALHLAYAALDLGPGDAVFVPAITFSATANAAMYCGATPVFTDVDPQSGLMTPELLEQAISAAKTKGLKPKLATPVHYAGLAADMNGLITVAKRHGIKLFEDACHALGGEYRKPGQPWRKVGNWESANESIGAALSFHPVKHVATGEGGAVTTNDDAFAHRVRRLRTHGITKTASEFKNKDLAFTTGSDKPNPWYMELQDLGWNYRMSDINAVLGSSQMRQLPHSVKRRVEIAGWYAEFLKDLPLRLPVYQQEHANNAWHLYTPQIDFDSLKVHRSDVMNRLREVGIGTQVHYIPVPSMPYYQEKGHKTPPNAWQFYQRTLSLPMYPALEKSDVQRVCKALAQALEKK